MKPSNLLLSLLSSTLLLAGSISDVAKEPALVVYNNSLGLVHEQRDVQLDKGEQALVYKDVASNIITESVNAGFPKGVTLYSQQYRFDQITTQKLAQAHLGKKVRFYIKTGDELLYKSGTLLSASSQALVKTDKEEIYTVPTSALIFSEIPSELMTKPSLVWNIQASKKQQTTLKLDYLIRNISWKSNYVLNLHEKKADLSGWITIDNRSGKAFKETKLVVLAGDINRVQNHNYRRVRKVALAAMADTPQVEEQSHEGYHLYSIPFKVTLANNEKTQIKFLDLKDIPVTRKYESHLPSPFYMHSEQSHPVTQLLEIASLDKPLPKGIIRTYSEVQNNPLLLGESSVNHTPKHEKVRITLGQDFDTKVKSTLLTNRSDRYFNDATLSYEVINRSDKAKTISFFVPFVNKGADDSSVKSKQKYQWKDGSTLKFDVNVKADSKKRFEVHYRAKK